MVLLVWFVSFIWLNQTDQMNQINSSRRMLKKTVQQGPSNSLYLSLGEGPRLSFTARIERLHLRILFCHDPLFLIAGWPARSPIARNFLTRPPTGTPRRAISPGEGLPIFPTLP